MNLTNEITIISEVLQINESDLSEKLGVSLETINNWKFGRKGIGNANLEKVYSFAYDNGIVLNNIYEQLLKEEYENSENIVLFHGAKRSFSMPIDFATNSKSTNNFGVGFYLGETFEQGANYISVLNQSIVYCFNLNLNNLKIYNFGIDSFVTIFAIDNVFSQDLASYLGNNNIIVRSGLSCAKLADEIINYPHVVRVSMHFYTTKEDIDKLIDALLKYKKGDELDGLV